MGIGGLAQGLLGRQVGDRADQGATAQPRAALGGGQAEVPEPGGAVLVQPDVGGLQVAVDDVSRVRVLKRTADVAGDGDGALDLEAARVGARQ